MQETHDTLRKLIGARAHATSAGGGDPVGFYLGPYFVYLGIGFSLGLLYVCIRYGIPLALGFLGLPIEVCRQIIVGFWAGIRGKPLPPLTRPD